MIGLGCVFKVVVGELVIEMVIAHIEHTTLKFTHLILGNEVFPVHKHIPALCNSKGCQLLLWDQCS